MRIFVRVLAALCALALASLLPAHAQTTATPSAAAFANPDDGNIPDAAAHPMAFPTATGFGKVTSVRAPNAVVYKINSLLDVANPTDGLITYRECALALAVTTPYPIPAGRPRYCVFGVSGQIVMQSPARITVPKIYIAGQTSPGGVEFRLGDRYSPVDSLIDVRRYGTDLILRHVRVRQGEHPDRISDNGDPIRLQQWDRAILDHVSTMYGTDESLQVSSDNTTVQWSIIGPNLCRGAGHTAFVHCKTLFVKPSKNVTLFRNLSQHGEQRGINTAVGSHPTFPAAVGQSDIVNNVVYNYVQETGLLSNQFGNVYANYIGNVAFRGPRFATQDGNFLLGLYSVAADHGFRVFADGNVSFRNRIAGLFGQNVTDPVAKVAGLTSMSSRNPPVCGLDAYGARDCSVTGVGVVRNTSPAIAPDTGGLSVLPWQITDAETAMRDVLAFAGADRCQYGPCRDIVDAAFVEDVRTCDAAPVKFDTGWSNTAMGAFGYGVYSTAPVPADSDNDGMPDAWEARFAGTDPAVWDANADPDGDGYPNIEEYLNDLADDDGRYAIYGTGVGALPKFNCGRALTP
jgi:hypothetical protein